MCNMLYVQLGPTTEIINILFYPNPCYNKVCYKGRYCIMTVFDLILAHTCIRAHMFSLVVNGISSFCSQARPMVHISLLFKYIHKGD